MHTTSYSTLIETVRLALPFSRYSELFIESCLHLAPSRVTPIEFRGADVFGVKKLVTGLLIGTVILRLAVVVALGLMTDRQTQAHNIFRASIESRGKTLVKIGPVQCPSGP